MTRRTLTLALLLALTCASATTAPAQRTTRARAAAPARVDLTGELASLFPANTFLYFEVADLASVAEEMGGVDALYSLVNKSLSTELATKGIERLPLSMSQFRAALGSSMAVGVVLPEKLTSASLDAVDPVVVGVVRAPSAEGADLLRQVVSEVRRPGATKRKPVVQRVGAVRMTTLVDPVPKNSIAYALVDANLVFGTPSGVKMMLTTRKTAPAKRLVDVPGFTSASARVPGKRQIFAYLNGAPMIRAFNEGVDTSLKGSKPGARQAESAEAAALKAFLGLDAFIGASFSALADGGNLTMQIATELDRSRGGLVSVLSDVPPIEVRAAAILPAETDLLVANSVDAIAIHDLVLRVLTPPVAKALGAPSPPEAIAMAEGMLGMKLRDEFLAAFGNEVVAGVWLDRGEPLARVSDGGPTDSIKGVALFELRNPATIEAAIAKLFAGEAGTPPEKEVYRDVEMMKLGPMSYAVVNGFGVVGERSEVVRVIDAVATGNTLASNQTYASAVGSVPNNVIMGVYVSPQFFDYTAKSIDSKRATPSSGSLVANGLFLSIQKDASGVYGTFEIPLPNLRLLIEGERPAVASR